MDDRVDDEVQEQLAETIMRLKKEEAKEEEKRERKYWANIEVPLTLSDELGSFTKRELDDIRKRWEIENASQLKKDELIALLAERIPESVEQLVMLWDNKRFRLVEKIARNGGYQAVPDLEAEQIDYLRSTGIVFTGTFQGQKVLAVPQELMDPLLSLTENPDVKNAVRRNTEWIKLTLGLLYYYGTLRLSQLEKLLAGYTNEAFTMWNYIKVMHEVNAYKEVFYSDKNGYSNIRVFNPEKVAQEHRMRSDLDFYPFTKPQLLKAGEPDFVERNKSYMQLVTFLTKHFSIDREEADNLAEECVYATRIGDSPNHVLQFLAGSLELEGMETVQALMGKVVNLMNNTREWFLKGYMSSELRAQEMESLKPLPTKPFSNPAGKKQKKIGRNDPCPCGSGKKYKNCCGR